MLRRSHENPVVQQLYDDFLEKPNSHKVGGQQIWAMNCGIRSGGMAGRRVLHCTQAKRECGHSVCHSRTKPAPAHPLPSPPLPCPSVGPRAAAHLLRALRPREVRHHRPRGEQGCG